MDEQIRKDALRILNDALEILSKDTGRDILDLKELSDHTIHNASLFQDDCSISIATIVYALSKIFERQGKIDSCSAIVQDMEKLRSALEKNDQKAIDRTIKKLFSQIGKMDNKIQLYIQEVINKARVKKGCKLCQLGLSTAQASEVMGVSQWDMMNYLGKTKINEGSASITDIRSRLKFTRDIFS